MVGLLEPSAGSISLDGLSLADDPVAYKRRIGYVPEEPYLYAHLTASEYLTLVGRLRGIAEAPLHEKTSRLLRLLQLPDSRYQTMSGYSKGMRQRVLLAAALLHNPELLVLDEPFSGLRAAGLWREARRTDAFHRSVHPGDARGHGAAFSVDGRRAVGRTGVLLQAVAYGVTSPWRRASPCSRSRPFRAY